eukprot:SAG11_NODE_18488_length_489_cov_2.435897_1_plen_87_part_10
MAETERARCDSGVFLTHTAEQAEVARSRATTGGADEVDWEEQDEVEWKVMVEVLAEMKEKLQLEVAKFQRVEMKRRRLQQEGRRQEA